MLAAMRWLPVLPWLLAATLAAEQPECEPLAPLVSSGHQVFDQVPPSLAAPLPGQPRIGAVSTERLQVFDLDDPAEDIWLYRLANALHIVSREQAIVEQLQFREGERYSAERLRETERILRERRWLYDARVIPLQRCGDEVDVRVVTRDVWSLVPTGELDRAGGDTSVAVGIQEVNLLGRGERLGVLYRDGVDRSGPGMFFEDAYFLGGPWSLMMEAAWNTDGGRLDLDLQRPFRNLDDRRSHGFELLYDKRDQPLFDRGERVARFQQEHVRLRAFAAASAGRREGVVRRWTLGTEFEDLQFDRILDAPLQPAALADDRRRSWAFMRYEYIEDNWDPGLHLDWALRPDDVYLGTRYAVEMGYAPNLLGADAERFMLRSSARTGWQPADRVLVFGRGDLDATLRNGSSENLVAEVGVEAHFRHHDHFGFFAELDATWTRGLTPDRQLLLGGATGLRGYPSRYQSGDRRVRLRLEERWFSPANPFRLLLVGAAAFVDVGRAWFPGEADDNETGWLANVGVGLRFVTTRGQSTSIFHVDLAVPVRTGGPDVDDFFIGMRPRMTF